MLFTSILKSLAIASSVSSTFAAPLVRRSTECQKVVDSFSLITSLSVNAQLDAQSITFSNAGCIAYKISQDVDVITKQVVAAVASIKVAAVLTGEDAVDAQVALTAWVSAHSSLLGVLQGSASAQIQPIYTSVLGYQTAVLDLTASVSASIPSQASTCDTEIVKVKVRLNTCVQAYGGLVANLGLGLDLGSAISVDVEANISL